MSEFTKDVQDIINSIKKKETSFDDAALIIYHHQCRNNQVYAKFHSLLGIIPSEIKTSNEIPSLPVSLFKNTEIKTGQWREETVFLSSGTGGMQSKHLIRQISDYHENATNIFEDTYGPLKQYSFLALLPNYMMNPASSLISMVDHFMKCTPDKPSGYFLKNYGELKEQLIDNRNLGIPTILFGVSFALLDFDSQYEIRNLENTIVIETGGMKKYQKEITRMELHAQLKSCFQRAQIHSEYGMTECTPEALREEPDESTQARCPKANSKRNRPVVPVEAQASTRASKSKFDIEGEKIITDRCTKKGTSEALEKIGERNLRKELHMSRIFQALVTTTPNS